MALFGFEKSKKEDNVPTCACNGGCDGFRSEETENIECSCCCGEAENGICCVKVLGAGCKSCHAQYEYAKEALKNMGIGIEVEYITDMEEIMSYGVMSMPALVVNEKVVAMGKVLKTNDIVNLLNKQGFQTCK